MKNFTSCFLGIPLPLAYSKEFEQLLIDVHSRDISIETVQPQTPHITMYYLDRQSQYSLDEVSSMIQPVVKSLSKMTLEVKGIGYFTQENPKVLFLEILYPKELVDFHNTLSVLLKRYGSSDNSLGFHPHMTIGRMKSPKEQESFKLNLQKIKSRLDKIDWRFEVNEVVLYGVDSTTSPEHQEKLTTFVTI